MNYFSAENLGKSFGEQVLFDGLTFGLARGDKAALVARNGTGKTTLLGTLIKNLWHIRKKAILMAPTGRAAKVMSSYTGAKAHTIHRQIYFPRKDRSGGVKFTLAPNRHRNTRYSAQPPASVSKLRPITARALESTPCQSFSL